MSSSFLDIFYLFFPYVSVSLFLILSIYRLITWFRVPMDIKWPLSPTPKTNRGVVASILKELVTFSSLYESDDIYWLAIIFLHFSLIFILLHVVSFLFNSMLAPDPISILRTTLYPATKDWLEIWTILIGFIAITSLLYILLRRLLVKEVREITFLRDYTELVLLLVIFILGTCMRLFNLVSMEEVVEYFLSLASLNPIKPPQNPIFLLHCLLAQLYIIYFPFSRCFHVIGYFINGWIVRKGVR